MTVDTTSDAWDASLRHAPMSRENEYISTSLHHVQFKIYLHFWYKTHVSGTKNKKKHVSAVEPGLLAALFVQHS